MLILSDKMHTTIELFVKLLFIVAFPLIKIVILFDDYLISIANQILIDFN